MKLYVNRTSFSFDDAEAMEPTQALELTEEDYKADKARGGMGCGLVVCGSVVVCRERERRATHTYAYMCVHTPDGRTHGQQPSLISLPHHKHTHTHRHQINR